MTHPMVARQLFWNGIEVGGSTGCWEWVRAKSAAGYGQFGVDGRVVYAHRFSYELLVGPIPKGLTIDHLCRNRACVNPDHLEAVTNRENILRGYWGSRTECVYGHPFDENTIIYRGYRRCRVCRDRNNAARYQKVSA